MSHDPEKAVDHRRRDHLQGQICCHRLGHPPERSQSHRHTVSTPSQRATGDIDLPSVYDAQLQMFVDMEELAKQQAFFDRKREQAEQDREHAVREREEMIHLNDHLLAQIVVLQNTRTLPPSPKSPSATEITSNEYSQSRRRRRAASPTPSKQSDESSSHYPRTKN